jgi:hypothetical protein
MKKYIILISLLFSLLACTSNNAPPPPPYNLEYEFYSDKNYQYIYRLILNNSDACTKQGVISKSISEGQLYTDIKKADVTISLHAPFGKYPHIRVNIESEQERTKVVVTNDFETWDELARVIQEWVTNETTFCR